MIDKLAKLDKRRRMSISLLIVVGLATISYYSATRKSIVTLEAAGTRHSSLQTKYTGSESERAHHLSLERQLEDVKEQLAESAKQAFNTQQAAQFMDNINAMAQIRNLKPMARDIGVPTEVRPEEATLKPGSLQMQVAKVTVAGDFFDAVQFVKELADRQQKVLIRNLAIALPPGEQLLPIVRFDVVILINSTPEDEQ